ncbi:hypothetical protein [Streptomyces sp. BF23-30]|nr:hypothetical protein OG253_32925 [Streptomyces virginiae]
MVVGILSDGSPMDPRTIDRQAERRKRTTMANDDHSRRGPVRRSEQPTLEGQFVSERRYGSPKRPETGPNYSIDSKGTTLPVIAIPSLKGDGTYDQDESGRELVHGLDVTLVLQ